MAEAFIRKSQSGAGKRHQAHRFRTGVLIVVMLILSGCAHVPPLQQRLVSKPNMQFSDSSVFNYQDRLLSQFESGSASSVGGRSSDCGSCVAGGAQ